MTDPRPAPYPSDTRAKGWRFEIDYEKVDQSDTWSLASEVPMAQPALLMMWLAAWTQEPCGSLPNDLHVIRTKCKVPAKLWPSLEGVLMRGWWLAEDGRLYHDTITARVLEMLDYRSKNAKRVADFKARLREQQAGNALPPREQPSKNDTGTGTGTKEEKEIPPTPGGVVPPTASPRAVRKCPTSFVVTPELIAWAASEAPGVPLETETAKLRDHTFKTAISDWQGAWRNWMRRAQKFIDERPASKGAGNVTFADQAKQRMDALTGRTPAPAIKQMGEVFDVANKLGR